MSTVYVGPYVRGPEEDGPSPHLRKVSLRQASAQVLRHLMLRLNPKIQRRTCKWMLALEIVIGALAVVTVFAAICGTIWPVTFGLGCLASTALILLLAFGLKLAAEDYRRQLVAVHPRRMLSPLAFRLANAEAHLSSDSEWSALQLEAVPPAELQTDDILLVEPGQFIHADGFIVQGTAIVDEAAVTGESTGVIREAGGFREVMRDSLVVMGRLLVQVAPQPIQWRSVSFASRTARSGYRRFEFALDGKYSI